MCALDARGTHLIGVSGCGDVTETARRGCSVAVCWARVPRGVRDGQRARYWVGRPNQTAQAPEASAAGCDFVLSTNTACSRVRRPKEVFAIDRRAKISINGCCCDIRALPHNYSLDCEILYFADANESHSVASTAQPASMIAAHTLRVIGNSDTRQWPKSAVLGARRLCVAAHGKPRARRIKPCRSVFVRAHFLIEPFRSLRSCSLPLRAPVARTIRHP